MRLVKTEKSPLASIDTSFANYVSGRRLGEAIHLENGLPDYAFDLDWRLRKKLDRIPHFSKICKKINATIETREIQKHNQGSVAVGPSQYPEIYRMGAECAEKLGIGIPNIFIRSDTEMNAYTYASDDVSPIIVLYTGIVDRMSPSELKSVIAHECGHIHNRHTIYKNVINSLLSGRTGVIGAILSTANMALMQFWTRASEVTADRAAVICAGLDSLIGVQKKLLSGGTFNKEFQDSIDLGALKEQLDMTLANPSKIYEVFSNHPSGIRRIFCAKEFSECEVFYKWRADMRKPGAVKRSKSETDDRCEKLVNILDN